VSELNEYFWQIDQIKKIMGYLNNVNVWTFLLQLIRRKLRMRCSENLFDMFMPSPSDKNNRGIQEIFQTIVLERLFKQPVTVCAITIEAGNKPGARVLCETYRSNALHEKNWVEFASVDAAVVAAGRLAHNKMCNGFHYRVASANTSFRDCAPLSIA
jgi:hypothetical protein